MCCVLTVVTKRSCLRLAALLLKDGKQSVILLIQDETGYPPKDEIREVYYDLFE